MEFCCGVVHFVFVASWSPWAMGGDGYASIAPPRSASRLRAKSLLKLAQTRWGYHNRSSSQFDIRKLLSTSTLVRRCSVHAMHEIGWS